MQNRQALCRTGSPWRANARPVGTIRQIWWRSGKYGRNLIDRKENCAKSLQGELQGIFDARSDVGIGQLERMQLSSVSRMLNHLLAGDDLSSGRSPPARPLHHALGAARALRQNLELREKRLPFLPSCNPGWKILIEIFIAHSENKPISITDLSHLSAIPTATSLRWLAILAEHGLVTRTPDTNDRRRTWLELTPAGQAVVEEILVDMASRLAAQVDAIAFA